MFDWEENLFLGLKALYRTAVVKPRERRAGTVRVHLREVRASLLLLGQMIAGRPLSLFETPDPVLCQEDRLFLPPEFSLASSRSGNAALYQTKTLLAALAIREGWKSRNNPLAQLAARHQHEFPGLAGQLEALGLDLAPHHNLWTILGERSEPGSVSTDLSARTPSPAATANHQITTEIEGRGQADVQVQVDTGDDGDGADLPMHTFEKVETLEEYTGLSRKSDSDDELQDHAEALQALKMTRVLRSAERPRSIYRSDLILDGLSLEVGNDGAEAGIPYPEWNHQRQAYRQDWCFVRERRGGLEKPGWVPPVESKHRALITRLRRQFTTLLSDWLKLRRQPVGSEFDLDALVDSEIERRSGRTPSEAIHLDRRRDLHDVSVMILMDQSYSTDAWIDDHRILDVIRESVFCVGTVLEDCIDSFALASFSSNTRRSCEFNLLKDFDDSWGTARARLGGLEPGGYTRIGPVLRHAQERLMRRPSSRKAILLLTDGRPCDYDRYEGTYGIKDVRKAIEVGRANGIQTHAFAVEKQAAEYFPRMFVQHHYDILPTPDRLAQSLCRIFARLLAG